MKKKLLWFLVSLGCLIGAPFAFAGPILELAPIQDTFALKNVPDNPQGGFDFLRIKNAGSTSIGTSFDRKVYLQYDTSLINRPIIDATLSFTFEYGGGIEDNIAGQNIGFEVYGLNDGEPGELWDETTLTWNNAPGNDISSGSAFLSNTTFLGNFSVIGSGVGTEILFQSHQLISFLHSDTNGTATFMISRSFFDPEESGYFHQISSTEGGGGPILAVTVPETSTVGILGFAGLLLFLAIRRKRNASKF